MTYEEFKAAYNNAFDNMMKYKPSECGAGHYANKMAELADKYPAHELSMEAELDAA
jgi:hypothetical protein